MATSARIKLRLLLILAALCSPSTWAGCPDEFSGTLSILDWMDDIPKSATLSRYEKGSDFKNKLESDSIEFIGEKLTTPSGLNYLQLNFKGYRSLSHKYDYRLVVNRMIEYRIYEITPSKRRVSSCPLESAKVNNCEADAYFGISFEKKCGKPLEK